MQRITYSKPPFSVFPFHLFAVTHPVAVPTPEGCGIVNTNSVNALDLKPSAFELVNNEAERGAGVRSGKDILVHEKTPDQILILPGLAETSDLQKENAIIVKHIIDL
jgi:hypothetical protein